MRRFVPAVAVLSIVAAGCGGGDGEATITTVTTSTTIAATTTVAASSTTTTTKAPDSTTTTTTVPAILRQSLTGQPVTDESPLVLRPALVVKIDNHPDARRNHTGLAVADIVFEELVEGGLTRFAAVFHNTDADPVGPIRSGRSQDVTLLASLNAPLFAWSGGNAGVTRLIRDSELTDLNYQFNTGSYYRGPGRSPHNVYSSTEELYALTPDDHPGPPGQQFEYRGPDDDVAGDPATSVELRIGQVDIGWDWDADAGRYQRSQAGSRHVDVTYGAIGAENVVVLVVDYRPSPIDSRSPEAQTIGEGPVYVFSDGHVVRGRWSRDSSYVPFDLVDDAGDPILLTPGQTWIELAEATGADPTIS